MNKFKLIINKFIFLYRITTSLRDLISLIIESKRYSEKYKKKDFSFVKINDDRMFMLKLHKQILPVHIRTYSGDYDIFYEVFWKEVYKMPDGLIDAPKLIIDLGANVGFTCIYYALHYPNAEIIAVEPQIHNFHQMEKNTAHFKNITKINIVISDYDKRVSLSDAELSYNYKISETQFKDETVEAISVERLMDIYNINHIDLIKIDIEGEERNILKHNNKWLGNVSSIIIEIHYPYQFNELEDDLSQFGFKTYPIKSVGNKMIIAKKPISKIGDKNLFLK